MEFLELHVQRSEPLVQEHGPVAAAERLVRAARGERLQRTAGLHLRHDERPGAGRHDPLQPAAGRVEERDRPGYPPEPGSQGQPRSINQGVQHRDRQVVEIRERGASTDKTDLRE